MTESNSYDIRQKLLEMQNQLLKNASHDPSIIPGSTIPPSQQVKENENENNDAIAILKEMLKTQQKMVILLSEINNRLKK